MGLRRVTSRAVEGVDGFDDAQRLVCRLAPAKINLYLHVTGRRSDGFHCLDSLFVFADFGDQIEVVSGGGDIRLTIDGPFASALPPVAGDNLVMKAAHSLEAFADGRSERASRIGANIRLTKNLPVAAGIGGGSADAAATLHALNAFWDVGAEPDELSGLAALLGADVPACLHARPVQAAGIGEMLTPAVPLPVCGILLVNPGLPLLTAGAFKAFAAAGPIYSVAAPLVTEPDTLPALVTMLELRHNDLQPVAEKMVPAISLILDRLEQVPDCRLARLSGSGPTCFGLFENPSEAAAAGQAIKAENPDWWVQSGSLLAGDAVDLAVASAAQGS